MKDARLEIRIPNDVKARLEIEAAGLGIKLSDLVRRRVVSEAVSSAPPTAGDAIDRKGAPGAEAGSTPSRSAASPRTPRHPLGNREDGEPCWVPLCLSTGPKGTPCPQHPEQKFGEPWKP